MKGNILNSQNGNIILALILLPLLILAGGILLWFFYGLQFIIFDAIKSIFPFLILAVTVIVFIFLWYLHENTKYIKPSENDIITSIKEGYIFELDSKANIVHFCKCPRFKQNRSISRKTALEARLIQSGAKNHKCCDIDNETQLNRLVESVISKSDQCLNDEDLNYLKIIQDENEIINEEKFNLRQTIISGILLPLTILIGLIILIVYFIIIDTDKHQKPSILYFIFLYSYLSFIVFLIISTFLSYKTVKNINMNIKCIRDKLLSYSKNDVDAKLENKQKSYKHNNMKYDNYTFKGICPKCGHRQTNLNECEKCGIIFNKYFNNLKQFDFYEEKYNDAVQLYDDGERKQAVDILKGLINDKLTNKIILEKSKTYLSQIKKEYEQRNNW